MALTVYPQLPKAWASWGLFCDSMASKTPDPMQQQQQQQSPTQWLDQAVTCMLQVGLWHCYWTWHYVTPSSSCMSSLVLMLR